MTDQTPLPIFDPTQIRSKWMRISIIVTSCLGALTTGYYGIGFSNDARRAFQNSDEVVRRLVHIEDKIVEISTFQKKTIIIDDLVNIQSLLNKRGKVLPEIEPEELIKIYEERRLKEIIEADNKSHAN